MNKCYEVEVLFSDGSFGENVTYTVSDVSEIKKLPFYRDKFMMFTVSKLEQERKEVIEKVYYAKRVTISDIKYVFGDINDRESYIFSCIKNIFTDSVHSFSDFYNISKLVKNKNYPILENIAKELIISRRGDVMRLVSEAVSTGRYKKDDIIEYVYLNFPIGYFVPSLGITYSLFSSIRTIEDYDQTSKVYEDEFLDYKEQMHRSLESSRVLRELCFKSGN